MPRSKKFNVELSDAQVKQMKAMLKDPDTSSTLINRIRVLLFLDKAHNKEERTNSDIAKLCGVSGPTVTNIARQFHNEGLDSVLNLKRNPRSDVLRKKLDGRAQADLTLLACSPPPEGRVRWTLQLLADEMKIVIGETISPSTIYRYLKKNELQPHRVAYFCLPKRADAEFVARMEVLLDLYARPYDPEYPVICMDEKPYTLHEHVTPPWLMRPGSIRKEDPEYKREGTCSIFLFMEPKTGMCYAFAREQRTSVDWAYEVRELVRRHPEAKKILLVMDNLSTHKIGSLYKAFPPEEAREIVQKLEIYYTPVHGSWLNIAEIGLNKLTRECLDRRIPSLEALQKELSVWNEKTNRTPKEVNWHFTTNEARVKLISIYPEYKEKKTVEPLEIILENDEIVPVANPADSSKTLLATITF